jgi:hypothetical protein
MDWREQVSPLLQAISWYLAVGVVCIILHLLKLGLKKLIKEAVREVINEEFEDE